MALLVLTESGADMRPILRLLEPLDNDPVLVTVVKGQGVKCVHGFEKLFLPDPSAIEERVQEQHCWETKRFA